MKFDVEEKHVIKRLLMSVWRNILAKKMVR